MNVKVFLKQNSKFYSTQVGYYNFFYPDKDKINFSNIKKEIHIMQHWVSPSGLKPFYFVKQGIKVIYWCDKKSIEKVELK